MFHLLINTRNVTCNHSYLFVTWFLFLFSKMKLQRWTSKFILVIFFCEVLAIKTQDGTFIKDRELLGKPVNAIENQSQSQISNVLLDSALDDHVSKPLKREGKIVELKKVSRKYKYNLSYSP